MIKKTILLIAACAIAGCGKKSSPDEIVMAFFEDSKNATQSAALESYFSGSAADELDERFRNIQSMHENHELSLSILDKAKQEDGTVRLKAKIEWSGDSGKGSMQEVFTLSDVAGEWKNRVSSIVTPKEFIPRLTRLHSQIVLRKSLEINT